MIIKFSQSDTENIQIVNVGEFNYSEQYLVEREIHWKEKVADAESRGASIWNSPIYFFHSVDRTETTTILRIGLCEFKDVLFSIAKGADYIIANFPEQGVVRSCAVTLITRTDKDNFTFPITNNKTAQQPGKIHVIGGNLNADETEINEFEDIKRHLLKEIEEETNLIVMPEDLQLYCLNANNGRITFVFNLMVKIPEDSIDSISKGTEIGSFEIFSRESYLADSRPKNKTIESLISNNEI